jgi:hypothetical protein
MRILGKGATKLNTIFRGNSVNVKAIVVLLLYKINEIATAKRVSEQIAHGRCTTINGEPSHTMLSAFCL